MQAFYYVAVPSTSSGTSSGLVVEPVETTLFNFDKLNHRHQ
jgi:hypothetical protein